VGRFGELQNQIYLGGLDGRTPELPLTYEGLEAAAREVMTPEAFGYVAGSAGRESTARANTEAFQRWRIQPRMLREITERDLTTELFGTTLAAPVLTAPVGALETIRTGGETDVARAASSLGMGMCVSTLTSVPMEEVAAAAGEGPRWFQLYWPRSRELAASLVRRAEASGYSAIVVTVDTWTLAWRPRDLALGHLPFLRGAGLANYFTDPVFRGLLAEPPETGPEAAQAAVLTWVGLFGNPALSWDDLAWLAEQTELPVLVKGIGHADDARAALDAGVAGVVVSNHGGRQVDGARAALDNLVDVADALDGRGTVLFDSGIRGASDILVALALGARAVLVGRPWVYGLALAGEEGVSHVLRNLLGELDITLGLAGYARPGDVDSLAVVRS
jgi:isopentenyl diphosphate isomerase/L-lactate dehydrogenase-like FMN-dependent dehydrogenase